MKLINNQRKKNHNSNLIVVIIYLEIFIAEKVVNRRTVHIFHEEDREGRWILLFHIFGEK